MKMPMSVNRVSIRAHGMEYRVLTTDFGQPGCPGAQAPQSSGLHLQFIQQQPFWNKVANWAEYQGGSQHFALMRVKLLLYCWCKFVKEVCMQCLCLLLEHLILLVKPDKLSDAAKRPRCLKASPLPRPVLKI